MKTADGMIRSAEVLSNKPKTLDQIRVAPMMGGGVTTEHHFKEMAHAPKMHKFKAEQGQAFGEHMQKHTGMSWAPSEGDVEPNAGAENEIENGDNAEA